MSTEYFFGVYLGRLKEPGIICSVSKEVGDKRSTYRLNVHLTGLLTDDPLGTVNAVKDIINQYDSDSKHLVVDMTNVGMTFVDLFKDRGLTHTALSATKDNFVDKRGEIFLVPRRDLLMNLFIMKNRLSAIFPRVNPEYLSKLTETLPQVMDRALYIEESKARSDPNGKNDYTYYGFAAALWYAEKGMSEAPEVR